MRSSASSRGRWVAAALLFNNTTCQNRFSSTKAYVYTVQHTPKSKQQQQQQQQQALLHLLWFHDGACKQLVCKAVVCG
jgi:hypothetical protein